MKKRLIAVGLIVVMSLSGFELAGASELSNARSQKSQAQSNLNSVNDKIDEIERRQASLQTEIDKVDADLVQVLVDLDIIKEEIADKKVELKQAESDLEVAKQKEAEQYDAMKTRIRYMYENGNSTFFTALLEANSFADVLNRVDFASKVYDADRSMLVEYQNTKVEVENLIAKVEEEKEDLEENQATYEEEQKNLETIKTQKKSQMKDFDSQLAQAEELADQYRATIEEQNEIISEQLAAQKAAAVSNVTAGATNVSGTGSSSAKVDTPQSSGSSGASASDSGSSGTKSDDSGSSGNSGGSASGSGQAVASYACQFVGNPYVYGGTSLTNGADCSGFVMSVYRHFGKSLPHSSGALRGVGRSVSAADMQPGDIVCYSGHVAIYIGGGSIVHASNRRTGIKISGNVHYKTILAVRRIF